MRTRDKRKYNSKKERKQKKREKWNTKLIRKERETKKECRGKSTTQNIANESLKAEKWKIFREQEAQN